MDSNLVDENYRDNLDAFMEKYNMRLAAVVVVAADEQVCRERIAQRGRTEDFRALRPEDIAPEKNRFTLVDIRMEKYREITQKVIDGYKDLGLVIEERNEDLDIDATVRRISEALRGKIYFSPADGGTDGILQPQRFVFRGMDVTMDFNSVAHGTERKTIYRWLHFQIKQKATEAKTLILRSIFY